MKAIIGDHSTADENDGQEVFKATSVNIHPDYDRNTLANDICIVKTENMSLSYVLRNCYVLENKS